MEKKTEDFLQLFFISFLFSTKYVHSAYCIITFKNFRYNIFEQIGCTSIQYLSIEQGHHMQGPTIGCCFSMDQIFAYKFWKRSAKEHFCVIISKSDQSFQRRGIKKFLYACIMQIAPTTRSQCR